jgi:hypothetical protein
MQCHRKSLVWDLAHTDPVQVWSSAYTRVVPFSRIPVLYIWIAALFTSGLSELSLACCVHQTNAQPYTMQEYLARSKLHDGTLQQLYIYMPNKNQIVIAFLWDKRRIGWWPDPFSLYGVCTCQTRKSRDGSRSVVHKDSHDGSGSYCCV